MSFAFGGMHFFYALIAIVGLMLLLPWPPYTGDPLNPETIHQAMAAIKLANLYRFGLGTVLIGLSIVGLVRESKISKMRKMLEPEVALTADPPLRPGGSGAWESAPPCMKFFYASIVIVGLLVLLAWSPYSYPYDPLSPVIENNRGVIGLVRESKINRMRKRAEPDAPPTGGPAMHPGNAGVSGSPPSVS